MSTTLLLLCWSQPRVAHLLHQTLLKKGTCKTLARLNAGWMYAQIHSIGAYSVSEERQPLCGYVINKAIVPHQNLQSWTASVCICVQTHRERSICEVQLTQTGHLMRGAQSYKALRCSYLLVWCLCGTGRSLRISSSPEPFDQEEFGPAPLQRSLLALTRKENTSKVAALRLSDPLRVPVLWVRTDSLDFTSYYCSADNCSKW